jgi:hypothetical protein
VLVTALATRARPPLLATGVGGWKGPRLLYGGGLFLLAIAMEKRFLLYVVAAGLGPVCFPAKWPEETRSWVGTGLVPANGTSFILSVSKNVVSRNLDQ